MSPVITQFTESTDGAKRIALQAFRASKSGEEWMFEFRFYRVRSVMKEGDAVVVRGDMLRSMRGHPMLKDATFSDSEVEA